MSRSKRILLILLLAGLVILGFDQNHCKSAAERQLSGQLDSLHQDMRVLQGDKSRDSLDAISDSINDQAFQQKLLKEFNILRDSARNAPVRQEYNTHIDKAENVHIGPN